MRPHTYVGLMAAALLLIGGYAASAVATTILSEDFEDDPLGPLGPGWSMMPAGSQSIVAITETTDHGHVLRLRGSPAIGAYLIASRAFSSTAHLITVHVDIKPTAGASFIWSLHGAGTSIGRRRIRLQWAPGSEVLVAQTVPSGSTSCGTLPSGVWSTVTLRLDAVVRRFDVLIDGVPTCTGVSAGLQPPFNSVKVMDASSDGWGGTVRFDNIEIVTGPEGPGSPCP
jgi:hypothetical protein